MNYGTACSASFVSSGMPSLQNNQNFTTSEKNKTKTQPNKEE